ncbi:acetylxylan esterase [Fodinicola feengrottensis]
MTSAIDRPLDELRGYRPKLDVPSDLAEFWSGTLAQARSYALDATFTPVESALRLVDVFDVRFAGYAGQPIAGWLVLPRQRSGPLPCIVQYVGYGGGRGLPHQALTWAAFGYAHFVMDTRGQGSQWSTGVTPDVPPAGATPHVPGFLTLGLPDRDNYYYRRVYTDAVRAIEAAASHPAVDTDRIVSCGGSQGGGLALAAGALADGVAAVLADVPFLCHFRRSAELAVDGPYPELVQWCHTHRQLADRAFEALAYFDGAVLAQQARPPALFSVAMRDPICPPSSVFAAYNHYAGDADISVWEWNEHEGGGEDQILDQIQWLATHHLAAPQ